MIPAKNNTFFCIFLFISLAQHMVQFNPCIKDIEIKDLVSFYCVGMHKCGAAAANFLSSLLLSRI